MILGLQITATIFSLSMIYVALLHYKKGELNGIEIVSWASIWITTIFIVIFPDLVRVYANSFAVSRLLDLLIAGGFILVISLVASSYLRSKRIEKKFEDYVRSSAISKAKKNNRKK